MYTFICIFYNVFKYLVFGASHFPNMRSFLSSEVTCECYLMFGKVLQKLFFFVLKKMHFFLVNLAKVVLGEKLSCRTSMTAVLNFDEDFYDHLLRIPQLLGHELVKMKTTQSRLARRLSRQGNVL